MKVEAIIMAMNEWTEEQDQNFCEGVKALQQRWEKSPNKLC